MKIIQRALKGSLIATGVGLVFLGGVYIGADSLGKALKKVYPEKAYAILDDAKKLRSYNFVTEPTRTRADLIYQSLK